MIDPSSEGLTTFALFTFNQEKYVRDAIKAALAQDYSPLQIIISDDASTDDTYLIVEDEIAKYNGSHSVRLNRNPRNLGLAEHLNLVVGLSESNFVVIAAGDDISSPERVRVLADEYCKAGTEYFYVSSNAEIMCADGKRTGKQAIRGRSPDNVMRLVRGAAMPLGATEACTKGIFNVFGGLHPNLINEDWVLPLRAHLLGRVAYLDRPLVQYRTGAGSISQDDSRLLRRDLLSRRARYLARQQIAVANMLHDLCFFDSSIRTTENFSEIDELKRNLCRRMTELAAVEAFNHYRSQARTVRAAMELFRAPGMLLSETANHMRRRLTM